MRLRPLAAAVPPAPPPTRRAPCAPTPRTVLRPHRVLPPPLRASRDGDASYSNSDSDSVTTEGLWRVTVAAVNDGADDPGRVASVILRLDNDADGPHLPRTLMVLVGECGVWCGWVVEGVRAEGFCTHKRFSIAMGRGSKS